MAQFVLPLGSIETTRTYNTLDAFTRGYIEAMFFTSTGTGDDEELENVTVADLADETLQRIVADCAAFQAANVDALGAAGYQTGYEYDDECAGRDYWFTRNGHGVGFWDRGLGDAGERLSAACRRQETDLYLGDDGRLYLS